MELGEQARLQTSNVLEALVRRIRRAGLSVQEVEERLGWPANTLQQALGEAVELRFEDVAGVLVALDLDAMEFFAEIYGLPAAGAQRDHPAEHPTYELSSQLVRWSSLRVLIWECKEKGVFTPEEAEKLLANLEGQAPAI